MWELQQSRKKKAFSLWKDNRRENILQAQRDAAKSRSRFSIGSTKLATALEVLLPPKIGTDRQVQHQIFSKLALVDWEALEHTKTKWRQIRLPEHKFNSNFIDKVVVSVEEDLDAAQLRVQLLKTLKV